MLPSARKPGRRTRVTAPTLSAPIREASDVCSAISAGSRVILTDPGQNHMEETEQTP